VLSTAQLDPIKIHTAYANFVIRAVLPASDCQPNVLHAQQDNSCQQAHAYRLAPQVCTLIVKMSVINVTRFAHHVLDLV
jgi:hypothetical protein